MYVWPNSDSNGNGNRKRENKNKQKQKKGREEEKMNAHVSSIPVFYFLCVVMLVSVGWLCTAYPALPCPALLQVPWWWRLKILERGFGCGL